MRLLATTQSICPTCRRSCSASYVERQGRVFLERTCPEHGPASALVLSDVKQFVARSDALHPPPSREELLSAKQTGEVAHRSCIALLEITDACNLSCAACYAQSPSGKHVGVDELLARMTRFIEARGDLDVLQLSGGEPTIHPEFFRILDIARRLPIKHIMINTNGLVLADDPSFARELKRRAPRLEVYLQMDGLDRATHVVLRGRDLLEKKRRALQALVDADIPVTLVCTVVAGVNDDEVGDVLRLGVGLPQVRGVSFQPATWAGRFELPRQHGDQFDGIGRSTLSDVLAGLEQQTAGAVAASDFRPLPCSHPLCCSFTFLARKREGTFVPVPRVVDVDPLLPALADRIAFDANDAACCGVDAAATVARPAEELFRVVVKPFMDEHTYDQQRIDECCVHIVDESGRGVSFCEHNVLHRGRKHDAASELVAIGRNR